jgi:hypothetical protein
MRQPVGIVIAALIAVAIAWCLGRIGANKKTKRLNHDATPTKLPATERFGDALARGSKFRSVEPSELGAGFRAKLLDVCRADSNVAGVWLAWLSSSDAAPELLATLVLDRPEERAIRDFIARADALGGPRFIVAVPDGVPTAEPFYRRSDLELPRAQ